MGAQAEAGAQTSNQKIQRIMIDTDKLPPQAIDMEEVTLGAMMLESDGFSRVEALLTPDMFYDERHSEVFRTMQKLTQAGKKIDILTVSNANRSLSPSMLASLTSRVGSAAHLDEHAAVIYEKWMTREIIKLATDLIRQAYTTTDIMELLKQARETLESRLLNFLGVTSYGITLMESADNSMKEYYKREKIAIEGRRTGIPSCINRLDKLTSGWQKEHLMVLAARPAMGKTSLAIGFLIEAARAGHSVAFYSLEMSSTKLADKILCSLADIDLGKYKSGRLTSQEKSKLSGAMNELESWKVTFSDSMLTDIDQIHASAKTIKNKEGLDFVIIDYLQLLTSRDRHANREREVAENSRKAKMMAVELDIPVMLLSQLNRSLESRSDRRPMLSDLRESGAIEQDADMVLFVYRDSVYADEKPSDISEHTDGELIIAKHREGQTGMVRFSYNNSLTQFSDMDASQAQSPF
jgi:replicative DNA helicase